MPQRLHIDNREFTLVREQRSGLSLYKSVDAYMRIGDAARIDREVQTHRAMEAAHFPIPRLIATGAHEGRSYFVESSLGEKTFRTLFEEDIEKAGVISDARFAEFLAITEQYLRAQAIALVPQDHEAFARGVHLDIIVRELPQYEYSLPDKFDRVLKKLAAFPFVLSHGDFNAANMFPGGVIDLEDSFAAPFGFDAVSAISTLDWFPDSSEYEYFARYRYTPAQRTQYFDMCDRVAIEAGYPKISESYNDFAFSRAIWSTVNMSKWPKLQAWRYDKFIKTYLYN